MRLKYLVNEPIRNGVGEPSEFIDPDWPRYVRITDFESPTSLREDSFRSLPPEIAAQAALKVGDVLVAAVGATFGRSYTHLRDIGPACFAGYLVKITPGPDLDSRYLGYWTESQVYWDQVRSRVVQSTIQNFSASKYRELTIALPGLPQQQAIAAFLDRKTAEIDALIAKKERLIELLEEKRTAVITQAVTKGIEPGVAMKESGVDWIGGVPSHWDVVPLKHLADFTNGVAFKPEDWGPEGVPIVRIENLNGSDNFNFTHRQVSERFHASAGDILFGWSGNRGTSFGPFRWNRPGLSYVNQHIFRIEAIGVDVDWLYWALRGVTHYIEEQAHGIIGMVHITRGDLGKIRVPLPPGEEMPKIARFLDEESAARLALIDRVRRALEHLVEYRSALITAAVTGQLEVPSAA